MCCKKRSTIVFLCWTELFAVALKQRCCKRPKQLDKRINCALCQVRCVCTFLRARWCLINVALFIRSLVHRLQVLTLQRTIPPFLTFRFRPTCHEYSISQAKFVSMTAVSQDFRTYMQTFTHAMAVRAGKSNAVRYKYLHDVNASTFINVFQYDNFNTIITHAFRP